MCGCHCHLAISHSTTCPEDFIAGQMGILLQGGADRPERDVIWEAQDTWQSAHDGHTSHSSHGSCIHVSPCGDLPVSTITSTVLDLSNSKDINQWLIWPCANLQKLFKTLPRWPCLMENRHFLTPICIQVPE